MIIVIIVKFLLYRYIIIMMQGTLADLINLLRECKLVILKQRHCKIVKSFHLLNSLSCNIENV